MSSVSATEAARQFSDLLNRVRYRGESFEIVRGGEVVARIVPIEAPQANVHSFFELLMACGRAGTGMADDLTHIQATQPALPGDPWAT